MSIEDQIPPEILISVRRYVKSRLRVSLAISDGTQKNQDAIQLVQDVLVHFIEDRNRAEDPVAYAVGISRRRVQDYFGGIRVVYTKLQDRLRYYLRNVPGFSLWPDESGLLLCGYAGWAGGRRAKAETAVILQAKSSPQIMKLRAFPTGDIDLLDRDDWSAVFEGVFDWFGGPVPFPEFTRIVCALLQITEYVHEPVVPEGEQEDGLPGRQLTSPEPDALRLLNASELMSHLWIEIQGLLPRQRIAYLLNPPDDETEILIHSGVASLSDIGSAIALTPGQYQLLWFELKAQRGNVVDYPGESSPAGQAGNGDEFVRLRGCLPIEDNLIARLLACTRNQVIGLRSCARQRLQRRMTAFRAGTAKSAPGKNN